MERHDDGCSAGDKRATVRPVAPECHQGANVLLMAEAIGGARSGEDPDGDEFSKKEPE